MREIMVDLETLDIKASAVVVSIAAVEFEPTIQRSTVFTAWPKITDQQGVGRTISESTLLFWMGQSLQARQYSFRQERRSTAACLLDLAAFLRGADTLWARGPAFDLSILRSMYEDFDLVLPWDFRNERCVRTMEDYVPGEWRSSVREHANFIPHHPVHDCDAQIEMVKAARDAIK